jgi:hypothetical protein
LVAAVAEPMMPPDEQSITSTPASFSFLEKAIVSSSDQPPSTSSIDETRTNRGFPAGQMFLTSFATSSGKRIRFSSEPPYSSLRVLVRGERKVCSR